MASNRQRPSDLRRALRTDHICPAASSIENDEGGGAMMGNQTGTISMSRAGERNTDFLSPPKTDGDRKIAGFFHRASAEFAVLFRMVAKWRTTTDEDGHYCFAVAL